MAFQPKAGDVIRYDFLWKEEAQKGRVVGAKDRPCAVVLTTKALPDGSRQVVVAPITHSPPMASESHHSIKIPLKVCRHLGLDDERSWIRTDQINLFTWAQDRIPVGVVPTPTNQWTYGSLPDALNRMLVESVRELSTKRQLKQTHRSSE